MSVLDELTSGLQASVRRAVAGRTQAGLFAEFDTMRDELETAVGPIGEALAVLGATEMPVGAETRALLDSRRAGLVEQLAKVRETLTHDPAKVRQGTLWRTTRQAIAALRSEALAARDVAFQALLAPFADGDRELADSLPPGTEGLAAYRAALLAFEELAERPPRTAADVAHAAGAGRRLKSLRERVEAGAVPEAFRDYWRELRGAGMPITRLTPEFRAWLDERGLAGNIVVRYRGA